MPVIRTLLPTEFGLLRDHLLRLDSEDRYRRFAGYAGEQRIAEYVASIDRFHAVVLAWIEAGAIRGAAELNRLHAPELTRAELAVTVEKAWQDRGIGTALLRRLLTAARNRGIEQVLMICLAENGRMRHIADKFRGRIIALDGELEATLALPAPDGLSLLQEAVDVGQSVVGTLLEQVAPRRGHPQAT